MLVVGCFKITIMSDPIIDLHSDDYFMGEALRQAAKAYEAGEVPVGAVIVREGRIIARGSNQVELLYPGYGLHRMDVIVLARAVAPWLGILAISVWPKRRL